MVNRSLTVWFGSPLSFRPLTAVEQENPVLVCTKGKGCWDLIPPFTVYTPVLPLLPLLLSARA